MNTNETRESQIQTLLTSLKSVYATSNILQDLEPRVVAQSAHLAALVTERFQDNVVCLSGELAATAKEVSDATKATDRKTEKLIKLTYVLVLLTIALLVDPYIREIFLKKDLPEQNQNIPNHPPHGKPITNRKPTKLAYGIPIAQYEAIAGGHAISFPTVGIISRPDLNNEWCSFPI